MASSSLPPSSSTMAATDIRCATYGVGLPLRNWVACRLLAYVNACWKRAVSSGRGAMLGMRTTIQPGGTAEK